MATDGSRLAQDAEGKRWGRIRAIYEAALDLPIEQRSAYLTAQCGDDDGLLREVQSLLDHELPADDGFLRPPPADERIGRLLHTEGPDTLVGRTIASFTIRRPLAQGGMGTVYLAEQARPRRDVALKVMRTGFWSRSAERRFEFEAQVLARLTHPNIAQVYESGMAPPVPAGAPGVERRSRPLPPVPYFAMEYVPGARPITNYAEERGLDTRRRLELFLEACDAVQYGHARGVIHRDLKPANVLVGGDVTVSEPTAPAVGPAARAAGSDQTRGAPRGDGRSNEARVKIIDFGVARATDADIAATTMHTDAGQLVGTLAYMSPEQCDADPHDLDVRTDVYSLGVVLYELLCGRPPYSVSKTSIVSAARTIREAEPARPRAVCGRGSGVAAVKRDLEAIVLKCLEKDRGRRYAGVGALADDVRRYLRGDPVTARPPTAFVRALRWTARHPVAGSAIASTSVGGLVLSTASLAVFVFALRPDHLDFSANTGSVQLLTIRNHVLHEWRIGHSRRIAEWIHQPNEYGGRRLAVLGFSAITPPYRGALCAFDVDGERDVPVWTRQIELADVPGDIPKQPSERDFGVSLLETADVFPDEDHPGLEIIACFEHSRSRRAIRIYDPRGTLLYGVWNDGDVGDFYWLSGPGLLLCAGADERVKERFIKQGLSSRPQPMVFALRPRAGLVSREYVLQTSNPAVAAVWRRYMNPGVPYAWNVPLRMEPKTAALSPERFTRLCIDFKKDGNVLGGCSRVIDEHGNAVDEEWLWTDDLRARRTELLGDFNLQLTDQPPTTVFPPKPKPTPAGQ